MPVVDGIFIPRSPLTPAESHVDFPTIDSHIVESRGTVERAATPALDRLMLVMSTGSLPFLPVATDSLGAALERALEKTVQFGYAQAQRELRSSRSLSALAAAPPTTVVPPGAGQYGYLARSGIGGVLDVIRHRAYQAAKLVGDVALQAFHSQNDQTLGLLQARKMAKRSLHNQVLSLVGEALNMGRAAGALTSTPSPPEFALRSEQLDANTCGPCFDLHGTITRVGSPEFFAILPPVGCLGGGRCRGIMVFADGPRDVRQPALAA